MEIVEVKELLKALAVTEEKVQVPEGLEERLSRLIDAKAAEERRRKWWQPRPAARHHYRWWAGTTVSLLVLALCVWKLALPQTPASPKDTFTDPEEAYKVLCSTLKEVSANLNSGIGQLSEARLDVVEMNEAIMTELTIPQ